MDFKQKITDLKTKIELNNKQMFDLKVNTKKLEKQLKEIEKLLEKANSVLSE